MNTENKETTKVPKTVWEKAEESFGTALMSAGMVLVTLLVLWLPFKIIPAIFGHGSNFVSTTLSSLFITDDTTSNQDKTNIDTKNTKVDNSGTSNSATQIKRVYSGKSDLQITLVNTGIIDPATKQFVQTNYAGYNDEIAIKFEVKNVGTNVSGAWKLRINTPSRTTPYFDSESQLSIKPGDKIAFTTTFDSPIATGINNAYITADPLNVIDESSESNNMLTVPLKVEGTYYNYNNNYNYGSNTINSNLPYGSLYTWTNINVNCYATPDIAAVNHPVNWYAAVSGGSGYYTYSWVGSDQLYSNESMVSKTYFTTGTKFATVTVTSNGQSVTRQCSVNLVY